jgi:IclR family transcriptional regulator, KDG regulon repressor
LGRIERSLDILNYLANAKSSCGVVEISNNIHLEKSSVSRILSNLEKLGWVMQLTDSTYTLGHKPVEFGLTVISRIEVKKVSQPYLIELNSITHETIGLCIRTGLEELFLDQVECNQMVRVVLPLGVNGPLWRGATGKAMLAFLEKSEIDTAIDQVQKSGNIILSSGRILEVDKLINELSEVRKQGFALSVGEKSATTACVASPIFDYSNQVVGSIGIAGPLPRFTEEVARELGPLVKKVTQNISLKLGSNQRL